MRHPLKAVLDWLRSGYPEGIPEKDHFAVLALLRRRLSDDEIDQVVALSVEHAHETPDRHIDYSHVRELIAGTIGEEPSEEDIERVTRRLGEVDWPLATSESRDEDGDGAVDSTAHGTRPK
ncbi:DUF3349 domain-containing protein [Rhodococcus qingshengii]|uniref:DUF3349 domain-containing protein n=1 Tax=Rhodococcus qingshengii TaxID=334542 RepID=UPI00211EBFBE|nr:DUF3349 domain-containing protein [Rhodococcus qingshengii]